MRVAAYCGLTFRDFFGNQPALPALRYFCCDHDYISPAGAALFFAPTLRRLRSECACAWYPMGDVLRQLTRSGCACTLRALVLGKAKNKHFYPKVHPEDFVAVATLPKPERLTVFLDSSLEFSDFGEVLPIPPFRPCTSSGSAVATSWRRKVWTSQTEMRRCAASRPCCGISIRCACCSSSPSPSAPAPAPRTRASTSPPRRSGRTARRAPRAASPWACPHPRRSPPLTPRTLSFARGNFDIGLAGPQAIADAWPRLARLCLGHASLLSAARSPTSCAGYGGFALWDPERVARYLARSSPGSRLKLRARGDDPVAALWGEAVKNEMARWTSEVPSAEPYKRGLESEDELEVWIGEGPRMLE